MPDGTTAIHSKLGGSGAERWIECPGSVALIHALGPDADETSEYAEQGTRAHALGADCLNRGVDCWEAMADHPLVTAEDADAVQVYADHANGLHAERRYVEFGVSHQAFHPEMFGTLDFIAFDPEGRTELVDYKHGAGVVVDVEDNAQLKYYAFAFFNGEQWPADLPRVPDDHPVRLTIVQPRGWMEAVRSWDTTAGAIRDWAYNVLHGAMQAAGEATFKLGDHCRFCPAKLVCPAMRKLGADAALAAHEPVEELPNYDDEWVGAWYARLEPLKMFIKAVGAEVDKRCKDGRVIATAKLVYAKVDREWKADAQAEVELIFGANAYEPVKLRTPAQVEKLPGGKEFVAEWSQKPEAALTVAPLSDKRTAQKPVANEEVFKGVETP